MGNRRPLPPRTGHHGFQVEPCADMALRSPGITGMQLLHAPWQVSLAQGVPRPGGGWRHHRTMHQRDRERLKTMPALPCPAG